MKLSKRPIGTLKPNPNNPRTITDHKFRKLVRSIREFPEMLEARPLVINEDDVVLGGNMRLKACIEAGLTEVPVVVAGWDASRNEEFVVKDNVGFGQWDWDALANQWDAEDLDTWGLDLPLETETERLSAIEFEDIYYTPVQKPSLKLEECLNLEKYQSKLKVINDSPLEDHEKALLTWFAYRFIRIDFESVANFYFFNASEEMQKVMERLRLVLCDAGLQGFIDDDLLHVHELIQDWSDD